MDQRLEHMIGTQWAASVQQIEACHQRIAELEAAAKAAPSASPLRPIVAATLANDVSACQHYVAALADDADAESRRMRVGHAQEYLQRIAAAIAALAPPVAPADGASS